MAKKPGVKRTEPKKRGPMKAMDYAAAFDWPGYFNAVAGKPARETLVKALELFETEDERESKKGRRTKTPRTRIAIDIGCGEGRDTRELLRRGGPDSGGKSSWSLMITDGSARGLELVLDSLKPEEHQRVHAACCMMEELPRRYRDGALHGLRERRVTQVDLVNASFSLPFCDAKELPKLWRWIDGLIKPGGRFAGQIFGDRDTWAHARKTTGITRSTVDRMFKDYVLEELREEEKDDVTTMGEPKHWHVFHIVARKRTPARRHT